MRKVVEVANGYVIEFSRNNQILSAVKKLKNRSFDPITKKWFVPKSSKNEVIALAGMFDFAMKEFDDYAEVDFDYTINELKDLNSHVPAKMNLYDYQKQGVRYAIDHKLIINADQPGLGKTVQSIISVVIADKFPCLIICPSSLKINWQREIEMWTDKKALILTDSVKRTFPYLYKANMAQFFITNYESLKKYFVDDITAGPKDMKLRDVVFNENMQIFKSIIVDEAHRCKEISSQQTKFIKGISQGKEMIQLLTGTPIVNKSDDLIALLGILDLIGNNRPFGTLSQFKKRFCHTDEYWDRLHVLLRNNCLVRREKKEVLTQLPDKIRNIITCEIDNRSEYDSAEADLASYLVQYKGATDAEVRRAMRGEVMVRIGILKNIAARGKMSDVVDYISDVIESGEKIIIFIHLKEIAEILKKQYPDAVTILGSDSGEKRQQSVDKFQTDPLTQIIICSIKAAGVGITLTASSREVFVEFPWHAADCEQCEDRAHRIGQKDTVQCTYMTGRDTIDEWNYKLIEEKRKIANAITGSSTEIEEEQFDSLLNFINHKK